MEKKDKIVNKSLVFCDISENVENILELINLACEGTLKEIKIYFFQEKKEVKNENFSYIYFERLLSLLYLHIFKQKKEDFLFKAGIFFPFLFIEEEAQFFLNTLLKKEHFDVSILFVKLS